MYGDRPTAPRGEKLSLKYDSRRLILLYYHFEGSNSSTIVSAISQLSRLEEFDQKSTWKFEKINTFCWLGEGGCTGRSGPDPLKCQPGINHILMALKYGLFELWPTTGLNGKLRATVLDLVTLSLIRYQLSVCPTLRQPYAPPNLDRLLHSLAVCLAEGTSANSLMVIRGPDVPVSVWENLLWQCLVTVKLRTCVAPVWLLFLLHGANRDFTLELSQSCNFSRRDKCTKLVLMTGHWGPAKRQVHSSIFIDEDEDGGGILELAKSHNYSVSLKEITYFWFASYADSFRRIYELYENTSGITIEGLQDLRRELGLDPQCWQSRIWDETQSLLRSEWEGTSRILQRSKDGKHYEWEGDGAFL